MRRLAVVTTTIAVVAASTLPVATARERAADHLQVLSINDLHGNLQPPPDASTGGAAYLATHLDQLRKGHPRTVTVGAGDLTGASPLVSGYFGDEPTIDALNAMGLRYSAVGNHEFDDGVPALMKLAKRSAFQWLAANVTRTGTDTTLFPPTRMYEQDGIKLGFIGLTLQDTPSVVSPGGTRGVRFADEAQTINRYAAVLHAQGADGIFVLLHEGGYQTSSDPNACENLTGAIAPIVHALSDDVDVVASGHTHEAYVCHLDGKLVAAGGSYGRLITDYDLSFDHQTHRLIGAKAHNVEVTRDVPPDPKVQGIVDKYAARVAPIADRVVGTATDDITRSADADGESALGDVIADAQLAATRASGAQVALVNPGNIRTSIDAGAVNYAQLYGVQPFGNDLQVKAFTGAQLRALLEQQFDKPGHSPMLQPSAGFSYTCSGDQITAMSLDGTPVADDQTLLVTMNDFLAEGGENFRAARAGIQRAGGPLDVDALVAYFGTGTPIAPGPKDRIVRE